MTHNNGTVGNETILDTQGQRGEKCFRPRSKCFQQLVIQGVFRQFKLCIFCANLRCGTTPAGGRLRETSRPSSVSGTQLALFHLRGQRSTMGPGFTAKGRNTGNQGPHPTRAATACVRSRQRLDYCRNCCRVHDLAMSSSNSRLLLLHVSRPLILAFGSLSSPRVAQLRFCHCFRHLCTAAQCHLQGGANAKV